MIGHVELEEVKAYLVKGMRLNLGKFVLHVIGVHGTNLFPGGSTEYFDDLN